MSVWPLIIMTAYFLSPILFIAFSISSITDDELGDFRRELERQVRRDMGIKKFDKEEEP